MSVRTGVDEYNQPTSDISYGYIGEFKYFGFETVPPHCLACDGSEISRETYSELFAVFGETFGAGDGMSTFNLPDLRGAFLRCIGGNAAELGTEQGDAIRELVGSFAITGRYDGVTSYGTLPTQDVSGACEISFTAVGMNLSSYQVTTIPQPAGVRFRASKTVPTADENRPVNYAVNICVIYE